jgi:uncharacterized membrane protein
MASTLSSQRPARARIEAIDLVRGLIIIRMALDHTRDLSRDHHHRALGLGLGGSVTFEQRWAPKLLSVSLGLCYSRKHTG